MASAATAARQSQAKVSPMPVVDRGHPARGNVGHHGLPAGREVVGGGEDMALVIEGGRDALGVLADHRIAVLDGAEARLLGVRAAVRLPVVGGDEHDVGAGPHQVGEVGVVANDVGDAAVGSLGDGHAAVAGLERLRAGDGVRLLVGPERVSARVDKERRVSAEGGSGRAVDADADLQIDVRPAGLVLCRRGGRRARWPPASSRPPGPDHDFRSCLGLTPGGGEQVVLHGGDRGVPPAMPVPRRRPRDRPVIRLSAACSPSVTAGLGLTPAIRTVALVGGARARRAPPPRTTVSSTAVQATPLRHAGRSQIRLTVAAILASQTHSVPDQARLRRLKRRRSTG